MICFANTDCTKVRLEAARMNKNSILPPLRQISYVNTVLLPVHFKLKWQNRAGNGAGPVVKFKKKYSQKWRRN